MLHGLLVSCGIIKFQRHQRLFLRYDALVQRFRCPCQCYPRRHHVQTHLFYHVNDAKNTKGICHPQHGTCGKDWFVVIGDLAVEIVVGLHKFLSHKADMDTAHGASRASGVAQQRIVGKGFTGDACDVRISGLL